MAIWPTLSQVCEKFWRLIKNLSMQAFSATKITLKIVEFSFVRELICHIVVLYNLSLKIWLKHLLLGTFFKVNPIDF
jgi:hypothetical protein